MATALTFWLGYMQRWLGDDGFINLRVVRNLLEGHGFVFNHGERIEAVTSPLWIALLCLVSAVRIRPEDAALALALVLASSATACAVAASAHQQLRHQAVRAFKPDGGSGAFIVPFGIVVFLSVPVAWDYLTSGLETSLSMLWLAGSNLCLTRLWADYPRGQRPRLVPACLGAIWLGVAPLVRPELSLFALAWLLGWSVLELRQRDAQGRRRLCAIALSAGLLPVGYQLFRMGYFAAVVPNTAIAKMAARSHWTQGWLYAENFVGTYLLLVPLVLCIGWLVLDEARGKWDLSDQLLRWLPIVCGLTYATYVIRSGGGFMHGRLLLPALFGLLLPVMVIRAPTRVDAWRWPKLAGVGVLVLWASVCAGWLRVGPGNQHGIGDERRWFVKESGTAHPTHLEHYTRFRWHASATKAHATLQQQCTVFGEDDCQRLLLLGAKRYGGLTPHPKRVQLKESIPAPIRGAVARYALGIAGYILGSDVLVIDRGALANELAARQLRPGRRRPGHERLLTDAWALGAYASKRTGEDPRVTAAREALACGALGELRHALRAPLTWATFWHNVANAWRFTWVQFPAKPRQARRQLCAPS